ncbi:MAG: hypothetical protein AAGD25_12130 [Cyanobacteria bacterium P01_F01_bin.150]
MENIADSFANLCDSYITLADRFNQLDVEHMTLKEKVVPLLKTLKSYQQAIVTLQSEKQVLQQKLQGTQEECKVLAAKNDSLKVLEPLLKDEVITLLADATEQAALVKETISEMDSNHAPDLNEDEKSLLSIFYSDPERFSAIHHQPSSPGSDSTFASKFAAPSPDPALV